MSRLRSSCIWTIAADCRRQLESLAASGEIWSGVRDTLLGDLTSIDGIPSKDSVVDGRDQWRYLVSS